MLRTKKRPLTRLIAVTALLSPLALSEAVAQTTVTTDNAQEEQAIVDTINRYIHDLAPPGWEKLRDPEYRKGIRRVIIPGQYGQEDRSIFIDTNAQVSLSVRFAFDSAVLNKHSKKILGLLARALNSDDLSQSSYFIGGHTDAKGSNDYNLGLSKNRAGNVQSRLVGYDHVAAGRLFAAGFGETILKDPSRPRSGVNRRVEVSVILPSIDFEPYHTDRIPYGGLVPSGYDPSGSVYNAAPTPAAGSGGGLEGAAATPAPEAPANNGVAAPQPTEDAAVTQPTTSAPAAPAPSNEAASQAPTQAPAQAPSQAPQGNTPDGSINSLITD